MATHTTNFNLLILFTGHLWGSEHIHRILFDHLVELILQE